MTSTTSTAATATATATPAAAAKFSASFSLESSTPFPLRPSQSTLISVFKHANSQLRVVLVPLPGPLCSLNILTPTLSTNHKGLPHTLEHLVFCGSRLFPSRGYLDYLATRNLSVGTNAYTTDDHTSYQITTAGAQGMLNVLGVFADHVLFPTLRDAQFTTEIYHLDGSAKHQGVVYCEMASRENTESDMLDLKLRQLLFQYSSTYAFECGGLTKDIIHLSNTDIKEYHAQFYNLDNTTIIITGQIDPKDVFDKLESIPGLLDINNNHVKDNNKEKKPTNNNNDDEEEEDSIEIDESPAPIIVIPAMPQLPSKLISQTVHFPTPDDSVGSIGYAWRGPLSEDFETVIALNVLFQYLQDTSASPFYQAFVEREFPIASDVDYDAKNFVETGLCLYFSGVPFRQDGGGDGGEEDEDVSMSEADEKNNDDTSSIESEEDGGGDVRKSDMPDEYYYQPGVFHKLVMDLLRNEYDSVLAQPDSITKIKSALTRHRRKILEGLEEDPHDLVAAYLIGDIVRFHVGAPSSSSSKQTKSCGGRPQIGTWSAVFSALDELGEAPLSFWRDLLKKWLLDAVVVEVRMIPDPKLAEANTSREVREIQERVELYGEHGLEKLRQSVAKAVEENKVKLTPEELASMPPVPDITKAPRLAVKTSLKQLGGSGDGGGFIVTAAPSARKTRSSANTTSLSSSSSSIPPPVDTLQFVETETAFGHVRFCFNTLHLPDRLRPYLVLFQELMFQSPLIQDSGELMDYRLVVQNTSDLLISHEAAMGLGNEMFHTSWLSEVFVMGASSEFPSDFTNMIRHLFAVLARTHFDADRILSIAKNLLSEVTELKRSGPEMLTAVSTRLTTPIYTEAGRKSTTTRSNDLEICIFKQEAVLNGVIAEIKAAGESMNQVVAALKEIQTFFINGSYSSSGNIVNAPSFVQVAVPSEASSLSPFCTPDAVAALIQSEWTSQVEAWSNREKMTAGCCEVTPSTSPSSSPFPFPRSPYSPANIDKKFGNAVMVPIAGLQTSFLSMVVPCDVIADTSPDLMKDAHAVAMLCELISRTEGPLYSAVRGNGLAYGAYIDVILWGGHLSFEISDSSEPRRAMLVFFDILEYLSTEQGFKELCSEFHLETARASTAYRFASRWSTAGACIGSVLRSSMRGLTSIKQEEANQKLLYSITPTDLQRVFTRYFAQFLNPNLRMTTLTTVSGDSAEAYRQSFNQTPKSEEFPLMGGNLADLDIPRYKLNLKIVTLNELELDV